MKTPYSIYWPQFYTATIYQWQPLLKEDKYKNIIVDSLSFLVIKEKITLNAFVIMSNHIHLIWQALSTNDPSQIQLSFMKFTAQQIKFELIKDNPDLLANCKVHKTDRD